MPQYVFINQETGEQRDFFYLMKEAPSVGTIVEQDGQKWKRVFTKPQAATNGLKPIDPHSQKAFREKTGAMRGTLGDLWDASAEQSARRAEKSGGVDEVKQKYFDKYKKNSKTGISHSQELVDGHKKAKETFEKGLKKIVKDTGAD